MKSNDEYLFKKYGNYYFNTASIGVPSVSVLNKMFSLFKDFSKNPSIERKYEDDIVLIKKKLKKFLNIPTGKIGLLRNTTEGLMLSSLGIPLEENDEVILTNIDHRSATNGWLLREKNENIKINRLNIDYCDTPENIINKVLSVINNRTKVIAIPHIDRYFGIIFPVEEISKIAREKNIYTLIDGSQAFGLVEVDIKKINPDIYVSCFHKWGLLPMTLGLIYIKDALSSKIKRQFLSGSRFFERNVEDREFDGTELGTRNVIIEKVLEEIFPFAYNFHPDFSPREYAKQKLKELKNIKLYVNDYQNIPYGIITLKANNMETDMLKSELEKEKIFVGTSLVGDENLLRISLFFYNTKEDIDYLIKILKIKIGDENGTL